VILILWKEVGTAVCSTPFFNVAAIIYRSVFASDRKRKRKWRQRCEEGANHEQEKKICLKLIKKLTNRKIVFLI
jgi:hypothetical protein